MILQLREKLISLPLKLSMETHIKMWTNINPSLKIRRDGNASSLTFFLEVEVQIEIRPWTKCCIDPISISMSFNWRCEFNVPFILNPLNPIIEFPINVRKCFLTIDQFLCNASQIHTEVTEFWTSGWSHIVMKLVFNCSTAQIQKNRTDFLEQQNTEKTWTRQNHFYGTH